MSPSLFTASQFPSVVPTALIQSPAANGYFDKLRRAAVHGAPPSSALPTPGFTSAVKGQQQQQAGQQTQAVNAVANNGGKKKGSANSVLLNKQIMACTSVSELLGLVKGSGNQFDGFNISSALARVPKLLLTSPSAGVAPAACEGKEPCGGDSLRLDNNGRALMDCLGELMSRHIDKFDARGLANAAWAIGKTKYTPTPALPALIASAALRQLETFNPQNLSNLMWSQVGGRLSGSRLPEHWDCPCRALHLQRALHGRVCAR